MNQILNKILSAGGRPYYVGGYVRDYLLGIRDSKDIDIEVFNLDLDKLKLVLSSVCKIKECGESFGVIKMNVDGYDLDISLPRKERKTGNKHTDFAVSCDPHMSVKEAASRRDFTINAIYLDILTNNIVDPYNGANDLKNRILRATSERFAEDPLRVLRGMQFAARFKLQGCSDTLSLCRALRSEARALPVERIWIEWEKMCTKGISIIHGVEFLESTGWNEIFPSKTLNKYDADRVMRICNKNCIVGEEKAILILASLLPYYDIDKYLEKIGAFPRIGLRASILCKSFLSYRDIMSDSDIRWLAHYIKPVTMQSFLLLSEGRNGYKSNHLWRAVMRLGLLHHAPEPIVKGRHLDMSPGPEMGKALKNLFERQLNGEFSTLDEWRRISESGTTSNS